MAAEVDKETQQANWPNGVAPANLNGLGDKTLAENAAVEQAVGGAAPVKATAPEPATAEPVASPTPVPEKEGPKSTEADASNPGEATPAPVTAENKMANDGPKPVEQTAPARIEQPTEALLASAPLEAPSEPAPADEKPLDTADAPKIVSGAPKPNGTVTTNGTTTISKEQGDAEMKDAPVASSDVDDTAAAAVPGSAADSKAEKLVTTESEAEAVVGEKRKAEEEPAANDALEDKKAKLDETPTDAEASKPAATDGAPAPALAPTTDNNSVNAADITPDGASAPKKAGRPKKSQKEKVPVAPAGRTLRKTRSQGPVEV